MSLRDRMGIDTDEEPKHEPLPPELAKWIRKEAPDVVLVMEWLRRHPVDYETILVLGEVGGSRLMDGEGTARVLFSGVDHRMGGVR